MLSTGLQITILSINDSTPDFTDLKIKDAEPAMKSSTDKEDMCENRFALEKKFKPYFLL